MNDANPAHGPHRDEVQRVLFDFTQRCFIGAVPKGAVDASALEWVRQCLRETPTLAATEIAAWPPSKQRALYEILQAAIILLGLQPEFRFPRGELEGSSAFCLSQPLLQGLSSARLPNHA